jgi:hypothetical protein
MDVITVMSWPLAVPGVFVVLLRSSAYLIRAVRKITCRPSSAGYQLIQQAVTHDLDNEATRATSEPEALGATIACGNMVDENDTGDDGGDANMEPLLDPGVRDRSQSTDSLLVVNIGNASNMDAGQLKLTDAPSVTALGTNDVMPSMAKMLLYCYSSLLNVLYRLLNCVPVCILCPAASTSCSTCKRSESRLFYAGKVKCGAWQLGYWVLLALWILLPSMPVLLWFLRQSPWVESIVGRKMSHWIHTSKSGKFALTRAIKNIASQPFVTSKWHWAAVLVAERLAMVSVTTFLNDRIAQAEGVVLVAVVGLALQLHARPYRVAWVNTLQTVAYACLVGLTALNAANKIFVAIG